MSVCVVLEFVRVSWVCFVCVVCVLCVLCGFWCLVTWVGLCAFVNPFCEAMFKSGCSTSQFCLVHEVNADFFKMFFSCSIAHFLKNEN